MTLDMMLRALPDVLEREQEFALIRLTLDGACEGTGGLLLVAGPAGIGKTTLLGTARDVARERGMRVLAGRGGQLESDFSFGLARQLFEPLLAAASSEERELLLAGAARAGAIAVQPEAEDLLSGSDPSFAVIHGLYWLTVNASGLAPLMLLIDDLHWADSASRRWVLYVADRLEGLPIALLLSWRTGETATGEESFARLEEIVGDRRLQPRALSSEAVRAVLAGRFDEIPAERLVQAAQTVTGGNPFLLRELVGSLRADQMAPDEVAAERVLELGPRSVARSVSLRVARLGAVAGELARAVAILGDGAQLRHVAELAGLRLADAAVAADRLAQIGILEVGTPLRFVHAIVRSAVYADIPAADRGLRHGEAARLLAADGADPDRVSAHLLLCEPTGSPEVVAQLQAAAAGALARGGPESAASYLVRALAESPDPRGVKVALLHELGGVEKMIGGPAAEQHLREALELAGDPARRAAIASDLSDLLVMDGQWDAAFAMLTTGLGALSADRGSGENTLPTSARLEASWAWFAAYDPHLVEEFDRRLKGLLATARGPDPATQPLAAILAGVLGWRGERPELVLALVEHALEENRWLGWVESGSVLVAQPALALCYQDGFDRVEGLIHQLLAVSRVRGSVIGVALAAYLRSVIRTCRGDLIGAETDLRLVVELAQQRHDLAPVLPSALWVAVDALIERPELHDVAALAKAIELDPGLARTPFGALLQEVRGRLALAEGNAADALLELQRSEATYRALHLFNPNWSCWRSALALARAGEDRTKALQLARSELADARRLGCRRSVGIVLRTLGTLEGGGRGMNHLREAVEVLEGSYARLEHARALVELGAALRRANQRVAARDQLRVGLDLAHRCGATRLAERARTELAATGARPRRMLISGAEALTVSERRVSELAAQGMTNPEIAQQLFVTINTVEGHLRHAYQKLSISSRKALPDALTAPVTGGVKPTQAKTTVPP